MKEINLVTLFTGGLSAIDFALKYENLEFNHIAACEIDKYARNQYLQFHREPSCNFYEDVSHMDGKPYKDKIDLMVWGSPCQDLSLAGKRKGFDGAKSSLFREGARIMSEVMPKAFIFENVKGLLSSNGGADYKEVIKTFQDMGYIIAVKVMNTKDYGVPQNRERVFIVGFLDEDAYHAFSFEDGFQLETRLKHYLDESVDEKYYLSNKFIEGSIAHKERHEERGNGFAFEPKSEDDIASCLSTKYGNRQTDTFIKLNQVGTLDIKGNDSINTLYAVDGLCPTLTTMGGGNREPKILDFTNSYNEDKTREYTDFCPTLRSERSGLCVQEPMIFDHQGRLKKWDKPELINFCPTLRAQSHGNEPCVVEPIIKVVGSTGGGNREPKILEDDILNPLKGKTEFGWHFEQKVYDIDSKCTRALTASEGSGSREKVLLQDYRIRKLTPKECFKLQGVKEGCIDLVVSDSQAYKIAGNAISVNVMQSLLRSLYKNVSKKDTLF